MDEQLSKDSPLDLSFEMPYCVDQQISQADIERGNRAAVAGTDPAHEYKVGCIY